MTDHIPAIFCVNIFSPSVLFRLKADESVFCCSEFETNSIQSVSIQLFEVVWFPVLFSAFQGEDQEFIIGYGRQT